MINHSKWKTAVILGTFLVMVLLVPHLRAMPQSGDGDDIRRVLLISIDGMHVLDFINCAEGLTTSTVAHPTAQTLRA